MDPLSKKWTMSLETLLGRKENGEINIDLQFRMDPSLGQAIATWTRWSISEDLSTSTLKETGPTTTMVNTACDQNDCDELNITLYGRTKRDW